MDRARGLPRLLRDHFGRPSRRSGEREHPPLGKKELGQTTGKERLPGTRVALQQDSYVLRISCLLVLSSVRRWSSYLSSCSNAHARARSRKRKQHGPVRNHKREPARSLRVGPQQTNVNAIEVLENGALTVTRTGGRGLRCRYFEDIRCGPSSSVSTTKACWKVYVELDNHAFVIPTHRHINIVYDEPGYKYYYEH